MNESKLSEMLLDYGYRQVNSSDYWSSLIAESYACGWGPDVAEDIELIKVDANQWRFSAVLKYSNEGAYSDDVVALFTCVDETTTGIVCRDTPASAWRLEILSSDYVTRGIMGEVE